MDAHPGRTFFMSYPIADIEGLAPEAAAALKTAGIRTTGKLLELAKDTRGRKALAARTGLAERKLLALANAADRLRIRGLGKDYAALLQAAGVETVRELGYRNPQRLAQAMAAANAQRKLVRQLPSDHQIVRWIDTARTLPPKISY